MSIILEYESVSDLNTKGTYILCAYTTVLWRLYFVCLFVCHVFDRWVSEDFSILEPDRQLGRDREICGCFPDVLVTIVILVALSVRF